MKKAKMSYLQHCLVNQLTLNQGRSLLWISLTRGRLTARHFSGAISLAKCNTIPPMSFVDSLINVKELHRTVPLVLCSEGRQLAAKLEYEQEFGVKVASSGMFLSSCGTLAATPAGLVGSSGIVEIICLYPHQNILSKLNYLKETETGNFELNTNHKVYHQVQGTLHLAKKSYCDVFLRGTRILYCIRVYRDERWRSNIGLLQCYYMEHILPLLKAAYKNQNS